MVEKFNAALIQMDEIQIHPTVVKGTGIMITEAVRGNGAILVNKTGKRFINEMETRDIVSAAILRGPGKIAYLVFDQSVRDSLKAIEGYAKQGLLTEGETLRDLATKLQMPADTLEATIAEYNGFVHNKKDAEFSRNPASMERALSTAPFYAIEIEPAVHHTMGGLKINTRAEVQNTSGASIPALFAAGGTLRRKRSRGHLHFRKNRRRQRTRVYQTINLFWCYRSRLTASRRHHRSIKSVGVSRRAVSPIYGVKTVMPSFSAASKNRSTESSQPCRDRIIAPQ